MQNSQAHAHVYPPPHGTHVQTHHTHAHTTHARTHGTHTTHATPSLPGGWWEVGTGPSHAHGDRREGGDLSAAPPPPSPGERLLLPLIRQNKGQDKFPGEPLRVPNANRLGFTAKVSLLGRSRGGWRARQRPGRTASSSRSKHGRSSPPERGDRSPTGHIGPGNSTTFNGEFGDLRRRGG